MHLLLSALLATAAAPSERPLQVGPLRAAAGEALSGWLEVPDQLIFTWVNGMETTPKELDTALFRRLRDFHRKETA